MAAVSRRSGPEGIGVGTRPMRWALVGVLGLLVLSGVIDGSVTVRDLSRCSGVLVALAGALVVTSPGDGALGRGRALLVCCCAVISAPLLLGDGAVGEHWLPNFSAYLLALLVARGNAGLGLAGGALLLALAVLSAVRGTEPARLPEAIAIPLFALFAGVIWQLAVRSIVRRERAHRSAAAQAELQTELLAEAAVADARELRELCADAEPLLAAIAEGVPISDELRMEIAATEAGIRDRLSTSMLQHPEMLVEVAAARRRGVRVLMLGNRPERAAPELARAVSERLAAVTEGDVVLRVLPPGRSGVLSMLITDARGERLERLTLSATGRILERRR